MKDRRLLDHQKYSECQLVAVVNAAAYLGEPLVDPDSEEYERLIDLVGARHGSAISIRLAVNYLRLRCHEIEPLSLENVKEFTLSGKPVSVSIRHPDPGLHQVLLTDGDSAAVRAWNLRIKDCPDGRLTWPRLGELMAAVAPHLRKAEWYELDPMKVRKKDGEGGGDHAVRSTSSLRR